MAEKKCRKEYMRQDYLKHREERIKYQTIKNKILSAKVTCKCGSIISGNSFRRHQKSKLHQRKLDKVNKLVVDKDQYILDILNDLTI